MARLGATERWVGGGGDRNRCVLAGAGIDSARARQRLGAIVRGLVLGVSVGDYP
jgi:hypothetical protein